MTTTVDESRDWDPLAGRRLSAEPNGARLAAAWAERDALSAAWLVQVLQEMGAFAVPGERRPRGALAADLEVTSAHKSLFEVLLDLVVASGLLHADGPELVAADEVGALAGRDLAAEGAALASAHPEVAAQLRLLGACLAEYPRLLRGEAKPIQVLFPGWSMDLVEGAYRGDPVSDRLNEIAAQAVAQRVFTHRGVQPQRILEVGAGTGGTTAPILDALTAGADRFQYTYTDISPSFLRHGKERFAPDHPTMRFEQLNIEAASSGPRLQDGAFDVVVAANVLHATRDLRGALEHSVRLLAPGGRLVLREVTTPQMWVTMSFGLLEGWWLAQDELRIPGSPLADVPTWTRLLTEAGLHRVAVLSPVADAGATLGQRIIVAEH